ncbi:MAG: hypothetical protein M1824_005902 [Vezdaea acicularis]|nr:MAG: hypothetical protein M1824_005902 [Vezdaea acicularis]
MSGPPSKPPPPKPSITPTGTPTLSPQIGSPPTLLSPTTTVPKKTDAYADKFSLHGRNAEVVGLLTKDEYARLGPLQAAVVDAVEKYEEIWKKLGPLQDSPARMDTEAGRAEQRELSQSSTANEALREKLKAEGEDIVQKLVKRFWAGVDFPIRSPLERARLVFAWVAKSFDNYPGCKEKWSSFERSNAATILWGKEVCHGYCELFLALYNHDVTSSDMQAVKVEGWDRSKPYERWAGKDLTDKSTKTTHDWIAVPLGDGTFRFMDPHWGSGRMVEKSVARSVKGTVVTEKTWEWESDFSPHWFCMDHELFLRTHWPNDPDRRYLKSGLSSSYQQWVEPRGPKYYSVLQKHLDVLTLLPDSTSIGIKDRTSIAVSFPKGCAHDKRTMTEYSIEGQKGSTAVFKPNGELWVANYKITEPVDEEFDLSFIIQPPGTKLQMVGAEWRCKRDLREQKKEVTFSNNPRANLTVNSKASPHDNPSANLTANVKANPRTNLTVDVKANPRTNLTVNVRANASPTANLKVNLAATLTDHLKVKITATLKACPNENLGVNLGEHHIDHPGTRAWGDPVGDYGHPADQHPDLTNRSQAWGSFQTRSPATHPEEAGPTTPRSIKTHPRDVLYSQSEMQRCVRRVCQAQTD